MKHDLEMESEFDRSMSDVHWWAECVHLMITLFWVMNPYAKQMSKKNNRQYKAVIRNKDDFATY